MNQDQNSAQRTPGPWQVEHFHLECHRQPHNEGARRVSRTGADGWPENLRNDGAVTRGGVGPRYCFIDEAAARAAIAKATGGAA